MKRNNIAATLVGIALIASHQMPAVWAQEGTAAGGDAPVMTVTTAPPETREVVAEGRAAIDPDKGGVLGARRAATAMALRQAVEKAVGVYVAARTLTQNYQMVRDQVVTRSDGFATLKEVIKEEVGADTVRVVIRAEVSLRPLAEQLKALNLTRNFRVHVAAIAKQPGPDTAQRTAVTALQRHLAEAGFVVIDSARDADLRINVRVSRDIVKEIPLDTAAGPMKMRTIRGGLVVQAVWQGTDEVVTSLSAEDTAMHIDAQAAYADTLKDAAEALAPRLTEALMVLPARDALPITVVVANLQSASEVARLEQALNALPGVRDIRRRSFAKGRATWEVEVFTDVLPQVPRALEENKLLRPFRLTVSEETRARIVARAADARVER